MMSDADQHLYKKLYDEMPFNPKIPLQSSRASKITPTPLAISSRTGKRAHSSLAIEGCY